MPTFPFERDDITVAFGSTNDLESGRLKVLETSSWIRPSGIAVRIYCDGNSGNHGGLEPISVTAHGVISPHSGSSHDSWGILTADCPSFVAVDAQSRVIGLMHLGWLQLYLNGTRSFFDTWRKISPSSVSNVRVLIGPSICAKCFTLTGWKGWVRIILFALSPWKKYLGRNIGVFSLDLRRMLTDQLLACGISPELISMSSECTFEDPSLSSHRRERGRKHSSNVIVVSRA